MPRPPRLILPNTCYHFLNRGNRQSTIFHDARDYDAFLALMCEANARFPIPVIAACLMPNHIHLVLRPVTGIDLKQWAHWLFTKHASHYHLRYKTSGHLWQGRYKSIPIQHDHHLLIVMRYVERNAFRARLIAHPENWRWGSLRWRQSGEAPIELANSPVPLPANWLSFVHEPQSLTELAEIRASIAKQKPFGDSEWTSNAASASGRQQTLRRVGRPRKTRNGA
jgi:putative transposase